MIQTYDADDFDRYASRRGAGPDCIERELGHADRPQLIQCRRCHEFKASASNAFRIIPSSRHFRTTCRKCEQKAAYHKLTATRVRRIASDPKIPDAMKPMLMANELVTAKQERVDAIKAASMKAFAVQWKTVRQLIAHRRAMLAARISNSKRQNGRLAAAVADSPTVSAYVEAVLHQYTLLVARLRNIEAWHTVVDGNTPPKHWLPPSDTWLAANQKDGWAAHVQTLNAQVMDVSPWEFTTREEREHLSLLDPDSADCGPDVRMAWSSIVRNRGNGSIEMHLYPAKIARKDTELAEMTPDWLRTFNGIRRPEVAFAERDWDTRHQWLKPREE